MERYTEDALMSDMILCLRELDNREQPNTCRVLAKLATDYTKNLADAQATVEALQQERDDWYTRYTELSKVKDEQLNNLIAALDAEREKVAAWKARVVEKEAQANEISGNYQQLSASHDRLTQQLSQLQALVRAAVERWRAQANVKEGISFRMAMKGLEATLDATPPVCQVCNGTNGVPGNENIVNGVVMCDYCHAKGGDGE